MPQYLPFPYPLPGGRAPAEGKRFEVRVPAAGVESARKLLDESEVESNGMFKYELREVDIVQGGRWGTMTDWGLRCDHHFAVNGNRPHVL